MNLTDISSLGRLSRGPFDWHSPLLKLFDRRLGGWISLLRKFHGLAYERLQLALHLLRFLHRRLEIGFHGTEVTSINNQLYGLKREPDENGHHGQQQRQTRTAIFRGLGCRNRLVLKLVKRWQFVFQDRKSTRLNSSHLGISYAVFCF